MKLVLIGFMGAGKTSVGQELARLLKLSFVDVDTLMSDQAGMSVPEIFEKFGEEYFRDLETETLISVLEESDLVISGGGGMVIKDENQELLLGDRAVKVIFLKTEFETVKQRIMADKTRSIDSRPLFRDLEKAQILYTERQGIYNKLADLTIATDHLSPEQVAREIADQLLS